MDGYEATVSRFDRWAGSYESAALQSVLFAPVHDVLLERVLRILPAPRHVLDVGCGTGKLLRATALRLAGRVPRGPLLVGLDASTGMLSTARARPGRGWPGEPVQYVRASATGLPFPGASFDLILCTFSYRHWSDQPTGLREIARVLTPSGLFAFADALPPAATRHPRWARLWRNPPPIMRDQLAQAGLRLHTMEWLNAFGRLGEAAVVLATPDDHNLRPRAAPWKSARPGAYPTPPAACPVPRRR